MPRAITLPIEIDHREVRLAKDKYEIDAALRLRYEVFCEQMGATPSAEAARTRSDHDCYDEWCDHLIVFDKERGRVLGTYRLIAQQRAQSHSGFYSETEFDLSRLLVSVPTGLLEVGRACVHPEFQGRTVLKYLWRGLAAYVIEREIAYIFGCASFPGTDPDAHGYWLDKLYRERLAPEELRARAIAPRYVSMRYNVSAPAGEPPELPRLLEGYFKFGDAWVGDGAVIDYQMNTVDVFLIVSIAGVLERYKKFFLYG